MIDALHHGSSNGLFDKEAVFQFITKEQKIPKGGTAFTVPKAKINPVEGVKTTFDVLMQKYDVNDPVVSQIGDIIWNYELNEETPEKLQLRTTLGVCYVLKGLENISQTDAETVSKAFIVMDALYATLKNPK